MKNVTWDDLADQNSASELCAFEVEDVSGARPGGYYQPDKTLMGKRFGAVSCTSYSNCCYKAAVNWAKKC